MDKELDFNTIFKDLENYKIAIDAHSIVAVTDKSGVITHVNEKFCAISKFSSQELIGSTHKIVNSGHHPRSFFVAMWRVISSGNIWNGEICNRNKYGELYWVDTTIVPVKDIHGVLKNYISVRTDITRLKKSEDHAHYMALHDELTGLSNRRFMKDYIKNVMADCVKRNKNAAVIMLDLDNFKIINDTLGHDCGDELLKLVAQRLSNYVSQPHAIIRLGGDEFLIILSDLSIVQQEAVDRAMQIAEEINAAINIPFYLDQQKIQTSVSSGIFIFQKIAQSELLKYADIALYHAKDRGKNCICLFDPIMEQKILANALLLNDLRNALVNDEFELYYQPIVNKAQSIIGYEALVRWQHPLKGLVLPNDFIGEIEKTDMIHKLGKKVISLACQQLKKWEKQPEKRQWTISINISVKQFKEPNFDEIVIKLVNQYQINPQLLRLELTESMFYEDMQMSVLKMKKLIKQGFSFSMDDFGTGYSSLNYLKLLPLSQLKIDRTFVKNMNDSIQDLAIVKTIIVLANILDLNVVAEGIETKEQFSLLKHSGCNAFQGYYFGRPEALTDTQ